jgi:hypothetical protein
MSLLDTVVTFGALSLSVGATIYTIFNYQPTKSGPKAAALTHPDDNFTWGVMGAVSCIPLFNYTVKTAGINAQQPYFNIFKDDQRPCSVLLNVHSAGGLLQQQRQQQRRQQQLCKAACICQLTPAALRCTQNTIGYQLHLTKCCDMRFRQHHHFLFCRPGC